MRPAHRTDNGAVLVALSLKVRMEVQHSILSPSPHDLLREALPLLTDMLLFHYH